MCTRERSATTLAKMLQDASGQQSNLDDTHVPIIFVLGVLSRTLEDIDTIWQVHVLFQFDVWHVTAAIPAFLIDRLRRGRAS